MNPDILPGDLVEVEPLVAGHFSPGIVVCVKAANEIPDAKFRGMDHVSPWSYWVFFPEHAGNDDRSGRGIRGPFLRTELARVKT